MVLLCWALTIGISGTAYAGIWSTEECHVSLTKTDSYTKDERFYLVFSLKTGQIPYASDPKTSTEAELVSAGGKQVFNWERKYYGHNETIYRALGFPVSDLASGTYTMKITVRVWNGSSNQSSWSWSYTINHQATASTYLDSATLVKQSDGSYANKITIGHSGCKGKVMNLEIYDGRNNLVYSAKGSKPVSYDAGTFSFTWGGFPTSGGPQCSSGSYNIKYWVTGGNPKQSTVWLDIY
jgi:hypothetical protein